MKKVVYAVVAVQIIGLLGCASLVPPDVPTARAKLQSTLNKERRQGNIAAMGEALPPTGDDNISETKKQILSCENAVETARQEIAQQVMGDWILWQKSANLGALEKSRRENCAKHFVRNMFAANKTNVKADDACVALVVMEKSKYKELEKFLKTGEGAGYTHTTECPKLEENK